MTTDVTTQEVTTQSTAAGGAVELGAVSSSREVWRRFTPRTSWRCSDCY